MNKLQRSTALGWMLGLGFAFAGCGGGSNPAYVLTIDSAAPASGVPIAVSPADQSGAADGVTSFSRTYNGGSAVTLTAPPTTGTNRFVSWSGCLPPVDNLVPNFTCNVTLNADTTVTANYAPTPYTVSVNSANPSSGVSIAASPADNSGKTSGSTAFSLSYNAGTSIALTAPATYGANSFNSWTGCTSTSNLVCNLTVSGNTTVTANYSTPAYALTVASTNPSSGVSIAVSPADNTGATAGATGFTRTYNAGTAVQLAAPATASGYSFLSWTGCASVSGGTCSVTVNANTTVTANFSEPSITAVGISPAPTSMTIGTGQQFNATVTGVNGFNPAVTWTLAAGGGSALSPGSLSAAGLYQTPYPAPPSVTLTATSVEDAAKSASVTFNLVPPAAISGPALSVDAGNQTHPISPLIYGWNAFAENPAAEKDARITVDRFGGDGTQRYNYLLDAISSASDYYFENHAGATGQEATGQVNQQIASDASIGAKTIVTVDVLGWVAKDTTSCSFPKSLYPSQYAFDPYNPCGDGELPNQTDITGNSATLTSTAVGPSFAGDWVAYLTGKFGSSASGGVGFYELDNEPAWWDAVHRDVHPAASTYDEVTNNGIAVAKAVKTADPTAPVTGPVIDWWWNYFYSKKDVETGWGTGGPCYEPWSNPVDRNAHGGVPMIEYYLQQFQAASNAYGARLLDYLDIHAYDAATYQGNSVAFTTAGDTGEQQARLNSTRALWDPTYTDPNFQQPNYKTDANYTASCNTPVQALQIIPMMQQWVAKDYPGTKTAITEYNWGGQESINGALAQADLLGIFGAYGLDMATLWGPPDPATQVPGLMAYEIFRNYDGAGSEFGDSALASTSANQGQLAVYGAKRSSDGAVTVLVLNKTYGAIASTLSLPNLTATGPAKEFLYSSANLNAIVAQPNVTLTAPSGGSTTSTVTQSFPAQSMTLLVIPTQ